MGGITEPTTEPAIVVTSGNDTINAGALLSDLDGLAGNDLLFLDYRALDKYQSDKVYSLELVVTSSATNPSIIAHYDPLDPISGLVWTNFTVTGIERVHFRASDTIPVSISTGDGNDTLVGGNTWNALYGGAGANLIYGGGGVILSAIPWMTCQIRFMAVQEMTYSSISASMISPMAEWVKIHWLRI